MKDKDEKTGASHSAGLQEEQHGKLDKDVKPREVDDKLIGDDLAINKAVTKDDNKKARPKDATSY